MEKESALGKVANEIKTCTKCDLSKTRINAVPGEGNGNAKIMFIGLSPGVTEDKKGRPFIGRAGRLLSKLLQSIELKREEIFITSVLKCHPPLNRPPRANEIKACLPYLYKQIEIINPKIIVLLGNTAIKTILGKMNGINKIHGKSVHRHSRLYFLTFHPAAGIRATRTKITLYQDFKKLKRLIRKFKIK